MITIIFGAPGAGKSSLNTYFLKTTYKKQGRALLEYTRRRIESINETRQNPLTLPEKPPIFADYKVRFMVGYHQFFEPYFCNGYFLGLANDRLQVQYIPPGSKIFLSEVQRYYDSRQSKTMPEWVSRSFEMHRHYGLDFYMDVQRVNLVDINIRELCRRFIEVLGMENAYDERGRLIKTVFQCREFTRWSDCEKYLSSGEKTFTETSYEYNGDIFRCFDSFNYFNEFLPDEANDFKMLPFADEVKDQSKDSPIYKMTEPQGYRTVPKQTKEKPRTETKQ